MTVYTTLSESLLANVLLKFKQAFLKVSPSVSCSTNLGVCVCNNNDFFKKENDYEFGMTFPSESLLPLLCAHSHLFNILF